MKNRKLKRYVKIVITLISLLMCVTVYLLFTAPNTVRVIVFFVQAVCLAINVQNLRRINQAEIGEHT